MKHTIHTSDLHGGFMSVGIEINGNNEIEVELSLENSSGAQMPLSELHDLMRQVDTAAACLQAKKGTEGNDE